MLSALDELQERREVSDSARGRLRGILSAPLEGFSEASGAVLGGEVRSSGLIRQSSRLSGMSLGGAGGGGGGGGGGLYFWPIATCLCGLITKGLMGFPRA